MLPKLTLFNSCS